MSDVEALKSKLEEMKAALERDLAMGEADRTPVELDQTSVGRLSRMDAMQVQAMAIANQTRRRAELDQIEAALRRIDSDEFGFCARCGEEIAEARLAHNPAVVNCIACAG